MTMKSLLVIAILSVASNAWAVYNRAVGVSDLPDAQFLAGQVMRAVDGDTAALSAGAAGTVMVGAGFTYADKLLPDCKAFETALTWDGSDFVCIATGAGGPDLTGVEFIIGTAEALLPNAQNLGALGTGLLLNTQSVGTGTLSIWSGNTCPPGKWIESMSASGIPACGNPTFSEISGEIADNQVPNDITVDVPFDMIDTATNNSATMLCDGGCTVAPTDTGGGAGTIVANDTACPTRALLDGDAACWTASGSTLTNFASTDGAHTSGSCIQYDANGNLTATGVSCDDAPGSDTEVVFNDGGVLGADADMTWNKTTNQLAVAGSAVAPALYGSTSAAGDLTIEANSADTDGEITLDSRMDIFPSSPDISTTNATDYIIAYNPDVTQTAGTLEQHVFHVGGTFTAEGGIPILYPWADRRTVGFGTGSGVSVANMAAMHSSATITMNGSDYASPGFAGFQLLVGAPTIQSEVIGVDIPVAPTIFSSQEKIYYTTTGTLSSSRVANSFKSAPTIATTTTTSTTTSFTMAEINGVLLQLSVQTGAGATGSTMTVTDRYGIQFDDASGFGGGSEVLTNQYGLHIEHLDYATNNYGIHNESTTIFKPNSSAQIIAATTQMSAPTRSLYDLCQGTCADNAGGVSWDRSGSDSILIVDGFDGQCIKLVNGDDFDTITIFDGQNVNFAAGANLALAPLDGVELCWTTEAGEWVQIQ